MRNYIPFTVWCRLRPWKSETLYGYYVPAREGWLLYGINPCDNSGNEPTCRECIAAVLPMAERTNPEVWGDPLKSACF